MLGYKRINRVTSRLVEAKQGLTMYPEDSSRAKSGANQVAKIKPNASSKLGVEGRAQKMSRQASSAEMTGASTNAASRLTKAGRTTKSAKRTSYCNTTALREKSSMRNITPQDLYNPTQHLGPAIESHL